MARVKFPGLVRNMAAKKIADDELQKMDDGEYSEVT